ncbi:MAG: S1C family serine protease [Candidatus Omnitrophica bacterium]|nr:S1C family serine protease [Candidatus Omnitrophota bacterium]MBU1996750.1 S1C family serine protease [Candidatus Omnitrophota bacterium]
MSIKRTNIFLSIFAIITNIVILSNYCFAQDSIINDIIKSKKSFVTVKAFRQTLSNPKDTSQYKIGSGVIISNNGIVVTNLHTIIDCNIIKVKLHNNKIYYSEVLTTLPEFDISLIKIKAIESFTPIEFADSNSISLGQEIINVSSSKLWQQTITGGIITGLGVSKQLDGQDIKGIEIIEINLNLDEGDSGGPLLNKSGELIGMITAKDITRRRKSYAIPSNKILLLYKYYKISE